MEVHGKISVISGEINLKNITNQNSEIFRKCKQLILNVLTR